MYRSQPIQPGMFVTKKPATSTMVSATTVVSVCREVDRAAKDALTSGIYVMAKGKYKGEAWLT